MNIYATTDDGKGNINKKIFPHSVLSYDFARDHLFREEPETLFAWFDFVSFPMILDDDGEMIREPDYDRQSYLNAKDVSVTSVVDRLREMSEEYLSDNGIALYDDVDLWFTIEEWLRKTNSATESPWTDRTMSVLDDDELRHEYDVLFNKLYTVFDVKGYKTTGAD